jgi:hypothetical protein
VKGVGSDVAVSVGVMGVVVGVMSVVVGVKGNCHKLVRGSHSPCRTRRCLFQMLHVVFVNVAVHPASQSVLMEMSDEWENPGTMWARVADCGSTGNVQVACVSGS